MTALAATPEAQASIAAPKEYVPVIQSYIKGMPIGPGWSIHIVSPGQWQGMQQTGIRTDQSHMPYAYSDLKSRVTYLRGDILRDPKLSPETVQRILAHELGHITLNTSDENKADKWARTYLKSRKR